MSTRNRSGSNRRPRYRMPPDVRAALEERRLQEAYDERPPYQRNDYLWWIADAKRPETKERRLAQMLDELKAGDVYMNMPWRRKGARSAGA
jgi:uncharacterized protein YdeI (YjbR/CyaY-like superfamily)